MLFLSVVIGTSHCLAQEPLSLKTGDTLPIYLPSQVLAEADKPTIEPAAGASFWQPGPERFYGWALRDLRDYLQKMTGAKYPLTLNAGAERGIFCGTFAQFPEFKSQQAKADRAAVPPDPEAFVIEVQGSKLFILGETHLGLMAGIYTLLDKLGCRWYAPGDEWENVPQLSSLTLDEKLNAAFAGPSFRSRFLFPSWGANSSVFNKGNRQAEYALWNLRNRMGGSGYVANAHNPELLPKALFETRPELFAKITRGPWAAHAKDGRLSREVARCNPEVVRLATETAVKYLKEHEGKGSFYNSFSVEPDDGIPADEDCVAKHGNATNLDFWFANQIAAGIEKEGLKDKWVGILSYSDHSDIPELDLHPRVSVTIASSLVDPKLTTEQRLAGFRQRKAQRIGIYDYPSLVTWTKEKPGWAGASRPFAFAGNLKRWHEHGANGYMAETSDSWINVGPAHYLASRLLWDIGTDPKPELDAYYAGAFGEAAAEIRTLYEEFEKAPQLTRGKLGRWHHLITAADEKLAGKANYRARINDIKRYYLYLNLQREFEIDLLHPRVPSKTERYQRMMRYVAANRGEGAFHALGLFLTLLYEAQYSPAATVKLPELGEPFEAIAKYNYDEAAWKQFPALSDVQIDVMFAAAKLPLDRQSTAQEVLDPAIKVLPASATPEAEIKFPLLHGIPGGTPRQYILKVLAPTSKLSFEIVANNALGAGDVDRTMTVTDESGTEVKKLEFKINEPVSFELVDVKPGVYTVACSNFGSEQVTVRGGNTLAAYRAYNDSWGFNPIRFAGQRAYFLVPAGQASLKVAMSYGAIALGFEGGAVIAPEIKGSAELKTQPQTVKFEPADQPRIAYVQWLEQGNIPSSQGLVIEGVTIYSLHPSYVLYESL